MRREEKNLIQRGDVLSNNKNNKINKINKINKWFDTFTKRAVALILIVSLVDLQLSYILAFMGKEEIAEALSITIVQTIIGVMLGYFFKALTETYLEEREKRLRDNSKNNRQSDIEDESVG